MRNVMVVNLQRSKGPIHEMLERNEGVLHPSHHRHRPKSITHMRFCVQSRLSFRPLQLDNQVHVHSSATARTPNVARISYMGQACHLMASIRLACGKPSECWCCGTKRWASHYRFQIFLHRTHGTFTRLLFYCCHCS